MEINVKTVISNAEELLDRAAAQVKTLLTEKPDAVLALSAGEDCLQLLERLAKMQQAGGLCFSRAKFFAVTEHNTMRCFLPAAASTLQF